MDNKTQNPSPSSEYSSTSGNSTAVSPLSAAESSAAESSAAQPNPNNLFTNSVTGKNNKNGKKSNAKGLLGGRLKKFGPAGVALALIASIGGFAFLGQSSAIFSVAENIKQEFASFQETTNSKRSQRWMKFMVDPENRNLAPAMEKLTKNTIFGKEKFTISPFQSKKFKKAGIYIEKIGGVKYLKIDGKLYAAGEKSVEAAHKKAKTKGIAELADVEDINTAIIKNRSVRDKMRQGTMTWRQKAAGWLSGHIENYLKRIVAGVRNRYSDFEAGKKDSEEEFTKKLQNDLGKNELNAKNTNTKDKELEEDGDGDRKRLREKQTVTTTDADGNEVPTRKDTTRSGHMSDAEDIKFQSSDLDTPGGKTKLKTDLSKIAASPLTKSSGIVTTAANLGCTVMQMVGAIGLVVAAYQTAQIITLTSEILEGIDKVKAGDGDAAPGNEISNALIKPVTSTYTTTDSIKEVNGEYDVDRQSTVTLTGSAMESEGMKALYTHEPINANDPSIKTFNVDSTFDNISKVLGSAGGALAGISVGVDAFRTCTVVRMLASAVSGILDAIPVVGWIKWVADAVAGAAMGIGLQIVVSAVVAIFFPYVAKVATRNFLSGPIGGHDFGNALASGSSLYIGGADQSSGASVADKAGLIAFRNEQAEIIAEDARYERENLSPFDITSTNTFLGSLANKMVPLANSAHTATATISSIGSLALSSFSSLLPASSAAEIGYRTAQDVEYTEKNCSALNDIGGVTDATRGDGTCTPYFISDHSTIDEDPAAIIAQVHDYGGIEIDESDDELGYKINKDSKLMKYLVNCGQRESPWGWADQNIAGAMSTTSALGPTGAMIVGVIPILGDMLDFVDQAVVLENFGYVSGETCVTHSATKSTEVYEDMENGTKRQIEKLSIGTSDWEETKYYQRLIEDDRLALLEGHTEKSAVNDALAAYYEEHPLDNSFEGILARRSGLTKENVVATLALIDVVNFIADYEPDDLFPTPLEKSEDSKVETAPDNVFNSYFGILLPTYHGERRFRITVA